MTLTRIEFDRFVESQTSLLSENTLEGYRAAADSFIRYAGTKAITPTLVDDWSKSLIKQGKKRVTVNKYRNGIKAFIDWKIRNGTWDKPNPVFQWKYVAPNSPPREAFTDAEYQKLITSKHVAGTWWEPVIVVAWNTGLRLSDVCMLEWRSVDVARQCIKVTPIKTKNVGKVVEIPLSTHAMEVINSRPKDTRYVITEAAVHYRTDRHKTISSLFGRILKYAGIEGKSFHSFRHSFVTRHLEAGANPAVLATITGHSLNTLMNYCHVSLDTKRSALKL